MELDASLTLQRPFLSPLQGMVIAAFVNKDECVWTEVMFLNKVCFYHATPTMAVSDAYLLLGRAHTQTSGPLDRHFTRLFWYDVFGGIEAPFGVTGR